MGALVSQHPMASLLGPVLLFFSAWVAGEGNRWAIAATLRSYDKDCVVHIGGSIARTRSAAEEEARESIRIRNRFIESASRQPPEHVAQALGLMEDLHRSQ